LLRNRQKEVKMKYVLATVLGMGLLCGTCFGAEKMELKEKKEKESYSMGYQFGKSLKAQELELNLDVYTRGIRDSLAGVAPVLPQEEMNKTLTEVQARAIAARQKELKEKAEKSLAEGKAFMEANKKKEGVVTLPSGLQYRVLKEGSGKMPKATDEVTVNYRGTFIDGKEFDSSYRAGKPVTFQVDKAVAGWQEALTLMKEGAKWQLFIPPELAYGDQQRGPIPASSTVILELELVKVK
jgi:FKBP-type peptidyl-prolyl cis-trans isomerase FklB